MPALVIKNLPEPIYRALKTQAKLHHRSMTQEAVAALEQELLNHPDYSVSDFPAPMKPKKPLGNTAMTKAKRAGMK
jgi:hypothetical protein